jgi:hypothetical protein
MACGAFPQKGHVIQYFFMRIQTPNIPSGSKMMIPIIMSPMAILLKFSRPTVVNHCFEMATIRAPKYGTSAMFFKKWYWR